MITQNFYKDNIKNRFNGLKLIVLYLCNLVLVPCSLHYSCMCDFQVCWCRLQTYDRFSGCHIRLYLRTQVKEIYL